MCVCVCTYTIDVNTSYTKQDMFEAKDTETQSVMAKASRLEFERDQFIDKWKNMQAKNADLQVSFMRDCMRVCACVSMCVHVRDLYVTCRQVSPKCKTKRQN